MRGTCLSAEAFGRMEIPLSEAWEEVFLGHTLCSGLPPSFHPLDLIPLQTAFPP